MSTGDFNAIVSKHLGQAGSYAIQTDQFDSSLLVPMPRDVVRKEIGVDPDKFVGYDVWHCHEATFLLDNGLPIAGTLKVVISCHSSFMVESKSFKLYLNSFDMCNMGETFESAIRNYLFQIRFDLEQIVKAKIAIEFFINGEHESLIGDPTIGYEDLYDVILKDDLQKLQITDYEGKDIYDNQLIKPSTESSTYLYYTNVLRSRCRHTKQKDTGTAFFKIKTKKGIVIPEKLLQMVISLREVNEFHEFCAEKLYTSIMSNPAIDSCVVILMYARRGSLDINPVRATHGTDIPTSLITSYIYTKKTMGQ
jgi:7-cyano-7-deazaguanine reductase